MIHIKRHEFKATGQPSLWVWAAFQHRYSKRPFKASTDLAKLSDALRRDSLRKAKRQSSWYDPTDL